MADRIRRLGRARCGPDEQTAALFVDGRYTEQVKSEADASVFEFRRVPEDAAERMDRRPTQTGRQAWLRPATSHARRCRAIHGRLRESRRQPSRCRTRTPLTRSGLIGRPRRWALITPHKLQFAGEGALKKIARARQALGSSQGLLISDPHNLAWLFNIRGSDVSYTPLPIGWAYLPLEGRPVVFLDGRKLSPASRQSLSRQADVLEPDVLLEFVEDLGRRGERVAFDAATVPAYLTQSDRTSGRQGRDRPRSDHAHEGEEKPGRACGCARRARAGRRRDGQFPWLVRQ